MFAPRWYLMDSVCLDISVIAKSIAVKRRDRLRHRGNDDFSLGGNIAMGTTLSETERAVNARANLARSSRDETGGLYRNYFASGISSTCSETILR